jgi:DNA-binding transcriptional ArsR family regulator
MPRSSAESDAFAAIAEPRRRELLGVLSREVHTPEPADPARDVTWLVHQLGWSQPLVSKHLGILRKAGLVTVAKHGRRRVYCVNGEELRHVYEWVKAYERFWDSHLVRLKHRAERLEREAALAARPEVEAQERKPVGGDQHEVPPVPPHSLQSPQRPRPRARRRPI